jgi:hypothetical protein
MSCDDALHDIGIAATVIGTHLLLWDRNDLCAAWGWINKEIFQADFGRVRMGIFEWQQQRNGIA